MTPAIELNGWIRIEWQIFENVSTSLEAELFNSHESSTPTETVSYTSENTSGALGSVG
jgi:hypothetical protein